ncbi:unnamed protein product, partial [Polarella glacialis]
QVVELTGSPGDLVVWDPRSLHSASSNANSVPRSVIRFRLENMELNKNQSKLELVGEHRKCDVAERCFDLQRGQLGEGQRSVIKQAWDSFDSSGTLVREPREVGQILKTLGVQLDNAEFRSIIKKRADGLPGNTIEFSEYLKVVTAKRRRGRLVYDPVKHVLQLEDCASIEQHHAGFQRRAASVKSLLAWPARLQLLGYVAQATGSKVGCRGVYLRAGVESASELGAGSSSCPWNQGQGAGCCLFGRSLGWRSPMAQRFLCQIKAFRASRWRWICDAEVRLLRPHGSQRMSGHHDVGAAESLLQNTEAEAHEQLDYAVKERGLKFMDTAEMYPVPTKAETQGRTDQYIGSWLKSSGVPREELVIASKVSGYAKHLSYLRDAGGTTRVNRGQIREAVEKSLQRLGTDYIDLLQIHWPDRHVSIFGAGPYDAGQQRPEDVSFEEQLRAFEELHKEGKVRHFGVSNETSLGVMSFAHAAEQHGLPKIVSIQNSYSLLVRTGFETDLAETCCKRYCNVGLLAYSPLAGGVLSGKYLHDDVEPGARLNLFKGYMERYRNSDSEAATREYAALAERHNMTPTQLALAWCKSRWFVTSSIIGATSLAQLKDNLDAFEMDLSEDALADIGRVYKRYRDPTINPVEKPAGQ